jgi:hypothetical protein
VHALLHHVKDLSGIGGELRPGIVHRLDRGTSGLIVVAKHDRAHEALNENNCQAYRQREVTTAFTRARQRAHRNNRRQHRERSGACSTGTHAPASGAISPEDGPGIVRPSGTAGSCSGCDNQVRSTLCFRCDTQRNN